jgi:hypothetical protein
LALSFAWSSEFVSLAAGGETVLVTDRDRVVFRWADSGPAEVDIRDYH